MAYDYVRRAYGVNPVVGQRVRHNETGNDGVIAPEDFSCSHYVQVQFEHYDGPRPCHPTALDYSEPA